MTIFLMIIHKMFNNRWIVGSLLLGLVITVALVSTIPSYTTGVLQNMMIKGFEEYQLKNDKFPGTFYQYVSFGNLEELDQAHDNLKKIETYTEQQLTENIGLPVISRMTNLTTKGLVGTRADGLSKNQSNIKMNSLSHIEEYIELIDGDYPHDEIVDGVYETLLSESALLNLSESLDVVLGKTIKVGIPSKEEYIYLKPVGVFKQKNASDPYWALPFHMLNDSFIISDQLFRSDFMGGKFSWISSAKFYTTFDYYQLKANDVTNLYNAREKLERYIIYVTDNDFSTQFPLLETLGQYFQLEKQFKLLMWFLNIPVLILLGFYLLMISRLIIDRQKTEIAVIRSRGSSKFQVLLIYLLEVIFLGAIALAIGPFLGLALSKILGASNGFIEFVHRQALPIYMTQEVMMYSLWTVLICIIMVMVPVYISTSQNIISHKQKTARATKTSLWHKFFVDFLLLMVAWYGWNSFQRRHEELLSLQDDASLMPVDPLLFFVPALFVIGIGLFLLRIYPWLIKIISWLGKKIWSPSIYITLVQVGRASKQYQFLMIFLIMTIAIGIYSASAARTINMNLEEQLRYINGADVVLKTRWESNAPRPTFDNFVETQTSDSEEKPIEVLYSEPPFNHFFDLPGVQHAAKVFTKKDVQITGNRNSAENVQLMGIEPKEFGQTAWFGRILLSRHWNEYLNLLAKEPSSVLLSKSAAKQMGVKPGDYITMSWHGAEKAQFVVFALIDYWPTWDPHSSEEEPLLVVANLPYIQTAIGMEPYHVWLNLKEGASSEELYNAIFYEEKIPVTQYDDVNMNVVTMKNSAFILGINGSLTLGFLISMFITFCGFLIYWILTIGSRILQYGVFRAMGISLRQLFGMLAWEQLLTSGMAIFLGIMIGGITSRIFVPLFELSFERGQQVTPFRVIFDATDEWRIYTFVTFMLLIGLGVLGGLLSRIRIHQAVKLGED
jgi:putative ABC transport system permease protein